MADQIKFYDANLSISCVDGAIEGIISSDPTRLHNFLMERDHEGSSIGLSVRFTPEAPIVNIDDPEEVYKVIKSWLP